MNLVYSKNLKNHAHKCFFVGDNKSMKKILMNKNLSFLTLILFFFVVQNIEAKIAASRNPHTPDVYSYSDLDSEYLERDADVGSRSEMDLFAGKGEFTANQNSVFTIDELKKDIRELKINIDDAKAEVTLFGSIPSLCSQHLVVESVRPSSPTNVYVGFRVSDFTGEGRACLAKTRGKTCEALGGCVSFGELSKDDPIRFQTKFHLVGQKTNRVVVSVQTRTLDKSRSILSWADYGQVETIRFKSKSYDDDRNSSSSRLANTRTHSEKDEFSNEYARTYIGKRKSSRNCSENVVEQFVVSQPMAPMMVPQQYMVPQQPQLMTSPVGMMAQPIMNRPMMPPMFQRPISPMFPPMVPPMMRPFPPVMPPMAFRPPMVQPPMIPPSIFPRPPMVMPPFMNGACPTGCVGGFRPGMIPPNFNQTLPAIRYPQINYPRNNLQLSLNANFGV